MITQAKPSCGSRRRACSQISRASSLRLRSCRMLPLIAQALVHANPGAEPAHRLPVPLPTCLAVARSALACSRGLPESLMREHHQAWIRRTSHLLKDPLENGDDFVHARGTGCRIALEALPQQSNDSRRHWRQQRISWPLSQIVFQRLCRSRSIAPGSGTHKHVQHRDSPAPHIGMVGQGLAFDLLWRGIFRVIIPTPGSTPLTPARLDLVTSPARKRA